VVLTAAAAAFRRSAPQIIQPHIIMARCRQLLSERLQSRPYRDI